MKKSGVFIKVAGKYSADEAKSIMLKNNLKPLIPYTNTQTPWKSKCLKCGKTVTPRLQKVLMRGHQCKYCSGHVIDAKEAKQIMVKSGFAPKVEYPGANKPWKSVCKVCKKITSPNLTSVKLGIGCKFCSKRAVDPKDAAAAMLRRGFKVLEDFPGAVSPWKVKCINCKRIFTTTFHSLNSNKRCKFCSGVAVDLKYLHKELRKLKLKPLEEYVTAKTPWKCKCLVCGHIVQPTWNRIKQGRGHCAYCAQRRVYEPDAIRTLKKLKLKPFTEFPGSNKPWKCLCLICQEIVNPRWSDLRRGQRGCSNCADWGLNYSKPGYIYLIENATKNAGKIGIGNSYKSRKFDDRIYRHEKLGWKLVKIWKFQTLTHAYKAEQSTLNWLRNDVYIPIYLDSKDMPIGGWTETFDSRLISLESIQNKITHFSQ